MENMRIAVSGCTGRMGITVLQATLEAEDMTLAGGLVRAGSAQSIVDLGTLAGKNPLTLTPTDDAAALMQKADAMIDFSTPELTLQLAALAAAEHKVLITGTTGFTPEQQQELNNLAQQAIIVQSFNMSLGVNLLAALVEQAAARLNDSYDIEILEMHHRHKVDAPSGTALMLGEAAAKGRKVNLESVADKARDGMTGARKSGDIGFAVLRGGAVIGDHTALFAGEEERIELTHRSQSRNIYAHGALHAARWALRQKPGLYNMRDVLGL